MSTDASPLKISGFGACMITGYPHETGGLFEVACSFVEKSLSCSVQSHIVSLGGFPVTRAEKYLKRSVVDVKPDYVVIQFGATDAQTPIRKKNRSTNYGSYSSKVLAEAAPHAQTVAPHSHRRMPILTGFRRKAAAIILRSAVFSRSAVPDAPTVFTPARWEIISLIGFFQHIAPTTPLPSYIETIGKMVDICISAGITPVVLSPFVFGSRYTMRNAMLFTDSLHEMHSRVQQMIFVDCVRLLSEFPRSEILLNDGFHLSVLAHGLIGEAIGKSIVADVVRADCHKQHIDLVGVNSAVMPLCLAQLRGSRNK